MSDSNNNSNNKSVTLQTAVLMTVKEFAAQDKQFSVHDITSDIREKTSSGKLEIPEVENKGILSRYLYDIQHVKVKELFDEMWKTGVFDNDFTVSRTYNGTFFEYTTVPVVAGTYNSTPIANTTTTSPQVPAIPPDATPNGIDGNIKHLQTRIDHASSPAEYDRLSKQLELLTQAKSILNSPVSPSQQVAATTIKNVLSNASTQQQVASIAKTIGALNKMDKSEVISRLKNYINYWKSKNSWDYPTIKQAQSSLKSGWTCDELEKVITFDLGYSISFSNSGNTSKDQINLASK